ncbi:MAG: hypothetical protein ACYTFA_05335 [Planctomycetota bacterium]|jgi:tetratricopeptide (TPR) repeat protein
MSGNRPGFSPPQFPEFITEHLPVTAEQVQKVSFTLAQMPSRRGSEYRAGELDAPLRRDQLLGVLELAEAKHQKNGLSVVLFPEASVPLFLLDELTERLNRGEHPVNSIVCFGLEQMLLAEFAELFYGSDNSSEYEKLWVGAIQSRQGKTKKVTVVNCAVVLCKTAEGIKRFVQVKFGGHGTERLEEGDVLEGRFIHLFRGKHLTFVPLICGDLIYKNESFSLVASLRREARRMYLEETTTLDFVFVLQCNPSPEDLSFRGAIDAYYDIRLSGGPYRNTCFVLPNASHMMIGSKRVEGDFGQSAIALPPKCVNEESACSLVTRNDSNEQDRLVIISNEPCAVHFKCQLLRDFQVAAFEQSGLEGVSYSPISDLEAFALTALGIQADESKPPVSSSHEVEPPLRIPSIDSLRVKLALDPRLGDTEIVVPDTWKSRVEGALSTILSESEDGGIVLVTGQPGAGKTIFLYLVGKELLARGHTISWLSGSLPEDVEDIVLFDDIDKLTPSVFSSLLSHRPSRALLSCRIHELEYLRKLLGKKLFRYVEVSIELSVVENRQFIRDIATNMAKAMDIDILPGALSALARRKGMTPLFVTTLLDEIQNQGGRKLTTAMADRLPTAFANVVYSALDSTLRALNTQQERELRILFLAALALYGKPMNPIHVKAMETQIAERIGMKSGKFKRLKGGHLPLPLRTVTDTRRIWFIHDAWPDVLRSPETISQQSATGRVLSRLMPQVQLGRFLRSSLREAVNESIRAAKSGAKEGEELTSLIRDAVERKWFDILPPDFPGALVEYEGGDLTEATIDLFRECSWKCMEASLPGSKSERNLKLSADALLEAAKHYRHRENWAGYAGIRSGLGLIYFRLAEIGAEPVGNLNVAAELFSEAAELYRKQENWVDYPEVLSSLGRVYFALAEIGIESCEHLTLSVQVLSEALDLYEEQEKWGRYARGSQFLGRTYMTLAEAGHESEKNLKSAVEVLSRAKELHKEQEDWENYADAVSYLADGYASLAEMGIESKRNQALAATATLEAESAKAKLTKS